MRQTKRGNEAKDFDSDHRDVLAAVKKNIAKTVKSSKIIIIPDFPNITVARDARNLENGSGTPP